MKLILIGSTQFGNFFPDFMLPLLYKGYCIEFIVFWKRVGGAGNARKTIAWLSRFYFATKVPSRNKVFLCHDRLHIVVKKKKRTPGIWVFTS